MNFEHLIAINDPGNPLIAPLSRAQLWAGLRYRVDHPQPFLPGLEAVRIIERHADRLVRELDFGAATIRDTVTQAQGQWVRFDVEPSAQHAGGRLTIAIEEPQPEALFLRFTYATTLAATPDSEDAQYAGYVNTRATSNPPTTPRTSTACASSATWRRRADCRSEGESDGGPARSGVPLPPSRLRAAFP